MVSARLVMAAYRRPAGAAPEWACCRFVPTFAARVARAVIAAAGLRRRLLSRLAMDRERAAAPQGLT